jgi:DNA-binding MarR family transcriptional regulator
MRAISIHESTLRYHLEKFERRGFLSSKKVGRRRCYFSYKGECISAEENKLSVKQKRVLHLIRSDPGITRKELRNKIAISGSDLDKILNRLVKMGKILKIRAKGAVGYELISKKKLKGKIFKQMVFRLINGEIDEATFIELLKELDNMG